MNKVTGGAKLSILLRNLSPVLRPKVFVFCSVPIETLPQYLSLNPLATFVEDEGVTLIIEQSTAQRSGLPVTPCFRCITLQVHSSLEAVGLTAAVAGALAEQNISANVVAAFYHDHIFVPERDADRALKILQQLSAR